MSERQEFKTVWFGLDRQLADQQIKALREKHEGRIREREKEIQEMKTERNRLASEVAALEEKRRDIRYESRFYQLASERLARLTEVLDQAMASDVKALAEKLDQKEEMSHQNDQSVAVNIKVYKDQLIRLLDGLRKLIQPVYPDLTVLNSDDSILDDSVLDDSVSDMALKYQYVLGKTAGEDLYDQFGQLIIGKDQPITEQVLSRAEEENKIEELVVGLILDQEPVL
jgi:hypothetical protein